MPFLKSIVKYYLSINQNCPMSKTHKIVLITALIILIPIVIYFVRFSGAEQSNSELLTIGAILPLNGVSSLYGQYPKEGMEMALAEINSKGGVNGKQLALIFEDTQSLTANAATASQKLINNDHVPVILTGASSPETLAEAPIAEINKVVLLAAGSAANKVRDAGDYIFRVKVAVNKEMEELMKFTAQELKAKSIYILYVENDYGKSVQQSAEQYFKASGGHILGSEGFKLEETDFRTFLLKAKSAKPDIVVLGGYARNMGYILKQAKELNINETFVAPAGTIGPEIIEIAGPTADGLIYITEFDLNSDKEVIKTFRENYKQKYNKEPELFSAMGYDAANIIAQMLKICGPNSTCIKDNLYKVQNYDGASGIISFDDHGDVIKPMIFMTIKDGKHVRYEK